MSTVDPLPASIAAAPSQQSVFVAIGSRAASSPPPPGNGSQPESASPLRRPDRALDVFPDGTIAPRRVFSVF